MPSAAAANEPRQVSPNQRLTAKCPCEGRKPGIAPLRQRQPRDPRRFPEGLQGLGTGARSPRGAEERYHGRGTVPAMIGSAPRRS